MSLLDHPTRPLGFGFASDGATFSPGRGYRYRLWRTWGSPTHRCVFVGLNPSKADETGNDMTITKCCVFAQRWGFGALDMVNVFGLVSTNPMGLLEVEDPVGSENLAMLAAVFADAHRIVWAWGSHNRRVNELLRERVKSADWYAIRPRCETGTLGRTQDGSPRHPSRLAYATRFEADTHVDPLSPR